MSLYAVNGKIPVSAWVPSRDVLGIGTTTLSDMAGLLTGTLTNMDAATDWVVDTDAGGIRALDFDGTNNCVTTSAALLGAADSISISVWAKPGIFGASGTRRCIFSTREANATNSFSFELLSAGGAQTNAAVFVTQPGVVRISTASLVAASSWQHIVFCKSGATVVIYRNAGVLFSDSAAAYTFADNTDAKQIGRTNTGFNHYIGLLDDLRVFNSFLTLADVQYLYAAGLGRGIQSVATGGNPRLINGSLMR